MSVTRTFRIPQIPQEEFGNLLEEIWSCIQGAFERWHELCHQLPVLVGLCNEVHHMSSGEHLDFSRRVAGEHTTELQ